MATVKGGGLSGQAGAIRHGISKALSLYDSSLRPALKKVGYSFVTGVPDSLLKELSKNFIKKFKKNHIISTNEGSAVGFAIGYYLGNKKPAVVYLQNSGLGNIINPITSLANPKVYGIQMLLITVIADYCRASISAGSISIPHNKFFNLTGSAGLIGLG